MEANAATPRDPKGILPQLIDSKSDLVPTLSLSTFDISHIDCRRLAQTFKKLEKCVLDEECVEYETVEKYLSKEDHSTDDFECIWDMCVPERSRQAPCEKFMVVVWLHEQMKCGLTLPEILHQSHASREYAEVVIDHVNKSRYNHGIIPEAHDADTNSINEENKISPSLEDAISEEGGAMCASVGMNDDLVEESDADGSDEKVVELPTNRISLGLQETSRPPYIQRLIRDFRNVANNFQNMMRFHERTILVEVERNNQILSELRRFKEQLDNIQGMFNEIAIKLRTFRHAEEENRLNQAIEAAREEEQNLNSNSNLTLNPFVALNDSVQSADIAQPSSNISTNPFLQNEEPSPSSSPELLLWEPQVVVPPMEMEMSSQPSEVDYISLEQFAALLPDSSAASSLSDGIN